MRVVVTMTTVPGREDLLIRSCESIVKQTLKPDVIYLNLPKISRRLNIPYDEIPDKIKEWCTIVTPDVDYGPVTKIYGGIAMENDPETIIISCDDDVIYPPTTFECLIDKSNKFPDACICASGLLIKYGAWFCARYSNLDKHAMLNAFFPPSSGRKVDLIFGSAGVLYKRKFFPSLEKSIDEIFNLSLSDLDILCNDDVLASGHLEKNNIDRIIFPDFPPVELIDREGQNPELALSFDGIKALNRMDRAISKMKALGYFKKFETVFINETITYNYAVSILTAVIIILLVIVMFLTLYNSSNTKIFREIFFV
jgi:hypothetical protein